MKLSFTKMHGLGNDFIVLDAREQKIPLSPSLIHQLAQRHTGIGFDQCLILETCHESQADFAYKIYNADGSEVAQCGNGARCLAKFIFDNNLTQKNEVNVMTNSHIMQLSKCGENIKVELGVPQFDPKKIPLLSQADNNQYHHLVADNNDICFYALSLGNPHAIIVVSNLDAMTIDDIALSLQHADIFPESVNVGFMQVLSPDLIKLRVYERGAGETLACGSGACAAVVAGIQSGKLDNEVKVDARGGSSLVNWAGGSNAVYLTGPAKNVYQGKIDLRDFSV